VAADFHHVLDQTLDRLVCAQFSFKALAKRVNNGLGQRLSCALSQRSRQPISIGISDAEWDFALVTSTLVHRSPVPTISE
jgi:hypothetical protein